MILRLIILCLFLTQLPAQPVSFTRERIEVSIQNNLGWVRGTYYFKNLGPTDAWRNVIYPVSENFRLSKVLSASVFSLSEKNPINFSRLSSSLGFSLKIPGNNEQVFRVVYCQAAPDSIFEYILTTTKNWHHPLEHAEYVIVLGNGLRLKSLSLPYDYKHSRGDSTMYFITRDSFMPDSNLIIKWEGD